jgi:hypothetical protein
MPNHFPESWNPLASLTTSYPIEQYGKEWNWSAKVDSYRAAISARQNGPQRAPEVSRQLPELCNSFANGNFGGRLQNSDEANMSTESHGGALN